MDRLEDLLGTTGDTRPLEQLAEEGAATALGGGDEVGAWQANTTKPTGLLGLRSRSNRASKPATPVGGRQPTAGVTGQRRRPSASRIWWALMPRLRRSRP